MTQSILEVKNQIEKSNSNKVTIVVEETSTDKYDTTIDVKFDEFNGCVFMLGEDESYHDAVKRAMDLFEEFRYVKASAIINA